jgi:hypothetical protein
MTTTRYDVFLSYRWVEPDKSWVRNELCPALQRAGLRVCLDVEDFAPGRNVILEMQRAGTESRSVLCVLSPEYFEGNRMTWFESLAARASDPSGSASTLVPLMLRETQRPGWIGDLVYVDWVDQSGHVREWRKLIRALCAPNQDASAPGPVCAPDPPQEQLRGKGNHLLVSNESPLTENLRKLLLSRRKDLGIEHDHYGLKAQSFADYKTGLDDFLDDPHPDVRWLFAVHPEDGWGRLGPEGEGEILDRLNHTDKRILFFESGSGFLKRDRSRRVFVVRTNYAAAVRDLIVYEVITFVRRGTSAHFVTLLGPRCSVADERRRVYNEFLAALQYAHGFGAASTPLGVGVSFWREEYLDLAPKILRVTSLPLDSWYRAEAETAVLTYCGALQADSFNTCFLCGNDDIALGARDAVLKLGGQKAIEQRRISFFGFDGIDEFASLVLEGLEAATMHVQLERMCEKAVQIVRGSGEQPHCEVLVPARRMGPARGARTAWSHS